MVDFSKFTYSVFVIDLRDFKTMEDLKSFLVEMKLDVIDPNFFWECKTGTHRGYPAMNKVWLDKASLYAVGYETKKERNLFPFFLDTITNLEPLRRGQTCPFDSIELNKKVENLSLDSILEKIHANGISSLTKEEKEFLVKS